MANFFFQKILFVCQFVVTRFFFNIFIRTSNFRFQSAEAALLLLTIMRFQPQIVLKLFLFPDLITNSGLH